MADVNPILDVFSGLSLSQSLQVLKAEALKPQADDLTIGLYLELALSEGQFDDVLDSLDILAPQIERQEAPQQWELAYLKALLATWQLERAQTMLAKKYALYEEKGYALTGLDQLEAEARRQEEAYQAEVEADKRRVQEQLVGLDELAFVQQQAILPQLHQFDDQAYKSIALDLLNRPKIHPLLKAYLLEGLKNRGFVDQVSILWYNLTKQVDLSRLHDVLDSPILKDLDGPDLIVQNVTLYVSLAYPFEMDLFPDAQSWVQAVEKRHQGDLSNPWLSRLEEMAQEMTF